MPLDIFSIVRGMASGVDAYQAGQKEQADQMWGDIENTLKTMASAQNIRQSAALHPLEVQGKQLQNRAVGENIATSLQTRQEDATTFEQGQSDRSQGIEGYEAATGQTPAFGKAYEEGQKAVMAQDLNTALINSSYNPKLADEMLTGISTDRLYKESQTKLNLSQIATPESMKSMVDNTPELKAILGEKDSYSAEEIEAGLKILRNEALNNKDDKQVEYLDARILYTDQLTKTSKAKEQDIRAGDIEGDNPYKDIARMKYKAILEQITNGKSISEAVKAVTFNLSPASIQNMINDLEATIANRSLRNTTAKAEAEKLLPVLRAMLNESLAPYQSEGARQQSALGSNTAVMDYQRWKTTPPEQMDKYLMDQPKEIDRVEIRDPSGKVVVQYSLVDEVWEQKHLGTSATRPAATGAQRQAPATQPKANAPTPQAISPKAQAIVDGAKKRGAKSINDISDKDIAQLKSMGLYDEVLKGFGGK